mmetsp:Transcript_23135/g.50109  ORF Transcript_23135/g.50109 Transcript_23135/m.50109 type:complete len:228 (-) Transcript_23135:26-709(-)
MCTRFQNEAMCMDYCWTILVLRMTCLEQNIGRFLISDFFQHCLVERIFWHKLWTKHVLPSCLLHAQWNCVRPTRNMCVWIAKNSLALVQYKTNLGIVAAGSSFSYSLSIMDISLKRHFDTGPRYQTQRRCHTTIFHTCLTARKNAKFPIAAEALEGDWWANRPIYCRGQTLKVVKPELKAFPSRIIWGRPHFKRVGGSALDTIVLHIDEMALMTAAETKGILIARRT